MPDRPARGFVDLHIAGTHGPRDQLLRLDSGEMFLRIDWVRTLADLEVQLR